MPSDLHQKLYVAGIPSGLTMTITNVNVVQTDHDEKWTILFETVNHGKRGFSMYDNHIDTLRLPFDISMDDMNGQIGTFTAKPYSGLFATGNGGRVEITTKISGTVEDPKSKTKVSFDSHGHITVGTTDWKGFARPDYTNVTYQLQVDQSMAPVNLSISVPPSISGMPDDALFVFGASVSEAKVGVNVTTDEGIAITALNYVIRGIFWVNEKLAGWAFGILKPF